MTPTIGRIVHYKTDLGDVVPGIVSEVITDTELMLYVLDRRNGARFENAVQEEGLAGSGRRWDWMPYQKLQPEQTPATDDTTADTKKSKR